MKTNKQKHKCNILAKREAVSEGGQLDKTFAYSVPASSPYFSGLTLDFLLHNHVHFMQ